MEKSLDSCIWRRKAVNCWNVNHNFSSIITFSLGIVWSKLLIKTTCTVNVGINVLQYIVFHAPTPCHNKINSSASLFQPHGSCFSHYGQFLHSWPLHWKLNKGPKRWGQCNGTTAYPPSVEEFNRFFLMLPATDRHGVCK